MKKTTNLVALLLICIAATLTSCSESEIFDYASPDQCMVLTLSPKQILENAGFDATSDGLKAPESINNMVRNQDNMAKLMKCRGISADLMLVVIDPQKDDMDRMLCVSELTDKGEFTDYLKEIGIEDSRSIDGYDTYDIDGATMLVKNDLLFFTDKRAEEATAFIDEIKTHAAENPLASWQKGILNDGNALSGIANLGKTVDLYSTMGPTSLLEEIYAMIYGDNYAQCYSAFEVKLKGNKAESETRIYDADGKRQDIKLDLPAVDTSLLKYAGNNDQAALITSALSVINWDDLIKKLNGSRRMDAGSQIAVSLLSSINGSVMISGGIDDAARLSEIGGWHVVIAAQMEDGAAAKYVDRAKQMIGEMGTTTNIDGGFMFASKDSPTISIAARDNVLVCAINTPVTEGKNKFDAGAFKGKFLGMMVELPAQSSATTLLNLPFGVKFETTADKEGGEAELKLTDTDKPLLEQLIEFASSL